MTHDPRIDAYIAAQADFARPILDELRAAVHAACPEAQEDIKWKMPAFLYRGRMLGGMAAFKAHAAFNIWRGKEIVGEAAVEGAMGQLGRLGSIADLPARAELEAMIRAAMAKTEAGPAPKPQKAPKPELAVPAELTAALQENAAAAATFEAFPPSCRRDYAEWVAEAKRPETRAKRVAHAVEWMAEGKRRNWKYEGC